MWKQQNETHDYYGSVLGLENTKTVKDHNTFTPNLPLIPIDCKL